LPSDNHVEFITNFVFTYGCHCIVLQLLYFVMVISEIGHCLLHNNSMNTHSSTMTSDNDLISLYCYECSYCSVTDEAHMYCLNIACSHCACLLVWQLWVADFVTVRSGWITDANVVVPKHFVHWLFIVHWLGCVINSI